MTETSKLDPITPRLRAAVFAAWKHKCVYCQDRPAEEVDHIFPSAKGGEDRLENYAASCQPCNRMKRDLVLAEGYLRIVEANAMKKAPAIRARLAREARHLPEEALIEVLVSARMLSRYSKSYLENCDAAHIQTLRQNERAEVDAEIDGWSTKEVQQEIGRINRSRAAQAAQCA